MDKSARSRWTIGVALAALVVAACAAEASPSGPPAASGGASASPDPDPSATPATYRIGVSNTVVDDAWRAAMICSVKAQATSSGRVSRVTVADRRTDAEGQTADIRNLIATGVDAIVLYPADPAAVAPVVQEALDAGVTVVSVGRAMDVEGVPSIVTDQEAYGYAGSAWLFQTLGGKGGIVVLRGATDDPIDAERSAGRKRAALENPDIKVVGEWATENDPAIAVAQINEFLAGDKDVDGIWTAGADSVVVDALKAAEAPLVPIVGADHGSFVSQLLEEPDLVGAAVTDPPAVGGAAVSLAIDMLDGAEPDQPLIRIVPEVWPNDTDAGKAVLAEANDPDIELGWPLSVSLPGRTTYTTEELVACAGPNG